MHYQMITIPITGFRIERADEDCISEWFDPNGFERAEKRLEELRELYPRMDFELLAIINA